MLTKSNSGISEFSVNSNRHNQVRVNDYNTGHAEVLSTIQSECDGIQQAPPASNLDKFQQFQSVKNKTFFDKFPLSAREQESEREELVIVHAGRGIDFIPPNIMSLRLNITVLDLSKNEFTDFPMDILGIPYLKSLRIDYNKIRTIPPEIIVLENLEVLSVYGNLIETLPPTLPKLTKLRFLDVGSNELRCFGPEVTDIVSLKTLNVYHNKLNRFPTSFKNLVNLVDFRLEWFRYTVPALSINQKDEEGVMIIDKLRHRLADLSEKKFEKVDFGGFLSLLSMDKIDMTKQDAQMRTIMHSACFYGDASVIEFLSKTFPFLTHQEDADGFTPFCLGLLGDKPASVHVLLNKDINFNSGGGRHGSILHIATKFMNMPVVKHLVQIGDDVNKLDAGGNTPLHYAISMMAEGYQDAYFITQYLLEHGANPNIKNKENWNPFHLAVRKRHPQAVDWILSYNFEVSEIHGGGVTFLLNKKGGVYAWTNLHIATYSDAPEMIACLAKAKVDPWKRSMNGFTAKRILKKSGLALKLMEKYEKDWIKERITNTKPVKSDTISTDLSNLQKVMTVKRASKNIFGDINSTPSATSNCEKDQGFGYVFQTRIEMYTPVVSSHRNKLRAMDTMDVDPEIENLEDEENTENKEFLTANAQSVECNEGERQSFAGSTIYNQEDDTISKTNRVPHNNDQQVKQFIRGKSVRLASILYGLDLNQYKRTLEQASQMNLEAFTEEAKKLQEFLNNEKFIFEEKLKVLLAIKILHKHILAYIEKNFTVPYPPEFFSIRIEEYNGTSPTDTKGQHMKNLLIQINSYYELVPEALIAAYESLDPKNFQCLHIKLRILGILEELKYFPAMAFYQNIIDSENNLAMLALEATKNRNNLAMYFAIDDNNTHEQVKSAYHDFLKNQYSKMPSSKKTLAPVLKVERKF